MKLGIEKTAMIRARAGISFALTEALDEGHCGLPRDELLPLAVKLLEIPDTIVLDALRLELDAGQVIADQVEGRDCVFLGGLYHAERSIADRLRTLARGSMPWKSIDAEKAIPWVEARTGLALADSQKTAITRAALESNGDHRRPWCRQDHPGEFHPAPSRREKSLPPLVRSDRTRGQTHDRDDKTRCKDISAPAMAASDPLPPPGREPRIKANPRSRLRAIGSIFQRLSLRK